MSAEYYRLYKNDLCIANCSFIRSENKSNSIYISDLNVDFNYRCKGLGTRLLYEVLIDVYLNLGVKYAFLVDATDRYRQIDNIYTKMGFTYIQMDYDNDMIGNLRHILFGNNLRTRAFLSINIELYT
jgi:GNAT superfamily N-acetyltransferase